MKKAYSKDIWRSMKKENKRFFSIMLITALGVTMLTGIKAACVDLRYSADRFFDQQELFDISIVSTLGLTKDDVQTLSELNGVEKVEGAYSETVYIQNGNKRQSAEIKTLSRDGINTPYLLEGSLPQESDEIVVTKKYISETGKGIGDTLTIEEVLKEVEEEESVEEPTYANTTYTITGIVVDPMDVNSNEGAVAFRSTATTDYTFFVLEDAVDSDIYTAIYLTLENSREQNSYSEEYNQSVGQVIETIESQIKEEREQARYDEIISEAYAKLSDAEEEMKEELGTAELFLSKNEFEEKKAEAEQKLADAKEEIEDIKMAQWYVQDRSSLSGYENIKSDADSIETIGTVFPIIFFAVAILISLTTITRRVEEDRGLIGTYKALGFTNREIQRKYYLYALAACILGGIIGDICGFILLPKIIFVIFNTMYQLPEYHLLFDVFYGIGGVLLFVVGIVGATILSCRVELKHMPATLIRPKAPRSGSRVLLEYITPLWKRFSFLNKVTARNLFRYKKRLFMTIAGIMGCTALLLCGFAIKDSVTDLMPRQYEETYQYDIMAVSTSEDNEKLLSYMDDEAIADYVNVQIETIKIVNKEGKEIKVQLIVVPSGKTLEPYINLENTENKEVQLDDNGVLITQNAGVVLDFEENHIVSLQNTKLKQADIKVTGLVKNYLGNNVYMTQKVYEDLFGTFEPNGVLVNVLDSYTNQPEYAEELGNKEGVLSAVSTVKLKDDFKSAFALINMVVYIIIIMAAGLAFTVLFTLSTTNISERERELATIKVLGFYDGEVHSYVNKETLILTGIGILLGLPLGYVLGNCLTYVLKMPSIYFAVSIHPISYVIAAVMSFVFAFVVNLITNKSLDVINPVEALKSVE